ncbi:hypothetical protein ES703_49292 [subsurface metagenome]
MGQLVPCGLTEVLPGDTFQHGTNALVRLSPLAAPVMHPVTVRIHHFFVPHRLSWDAVGPGTSWEDFITGGPLGTDAAQVPKMLATGTPNDLMDYLGIPTVAGQSVSSMPIRCYNMIYNEFYRDQDLHPEQGLEGTSILPVAWEKDYFSTARPWAQKGDAVTLPIGARAPVHGFGVTNQTPDHLPDSEAYETGKSAVSTYAQSWNISDEAGLVEEDPDNAGFPNLWADLSEATGVDINQVRKAFALQRFAEARAQYGSRYTEYLRYMGVRSADARLQRPEYIGGGKVQVSISEVLQTGPDVQGGADSFVGDLFGHGIAAMRSNKYRRHFTEHGYVMSLLSVRPKAMYQDGVPRHWLRQHREDFFQKELQHIGQQEIWNAELFATDDDVEGHNTWGFSDRYAEYRSEASNVTSEFRNILDYWHMARKFEEPPVLNNSFTDCVPTKRIFSEQEQHSLWIFVQHRLAARRLVSKPQQSRIM